MKGQLLQVAVYARVSSDQQKEARTISGRLAALRERVDADSLTLTDELAFVDDGYSEATLIRPELERLHDAIAAGAVDQLYVLESDRLARKYAYQILLVDEFKRAGIEVIFLNRKLAQTPEDERAKILERGRRGERQAVKAGEISVLGHAPYGYRYVRKAEGGGRVRYEVLFEEARVVGLYARSSSWSG